MTIINTENAKCLLDENQLQKEFYPQIVSCRKDKTGGSDVDLIAKISSKYNYEELEIMMRLLNRDIKVKEYSNNYFLNSWITIIALATIMITLVSDYVNKTNLFYPYIFLGLVVVIIITIHNISSYQYQKVNRILVYLELAKDVREAKDKMTNE
ncbi:Uncharacterised protein [Lysinibacillus sphaericus]|nr:Uncharacterised protein [Lysinibacillus sphaericus]